MTILFVCRGNVARSQMAAAFYRHLTGQPAESAGTRVHPASREVTINEMGLVDDILASMREVGLDIGECSPRQLEPAMLAVARLVVVLAEESAVPDWLRDHPGVIRWEVDDPAEQPLPTVRRIRDEIEERVTKLVAGS